MVISKATHCVFLFFFIPAPYLSRTNCSESYVVAIRRIRGKARARASEKERLPSPTISTIPVATSIHLATHSLSCALALTGSRHSMRCSAVAAVAAPTSQASSSSPTARPGSFPKSENAPFSSPNAVCFSPHACASRNIARLLPVQSDTNSGKSLPYTFTVHKSHRVLCENLCRRESADGEGKEKEGRKEEIGGRNSAGR